MSAADNMRMEISEWWPKLTEASRQWLINHNGEAVPSNIVGEISAAGGVVTTDAWWVGETGPAGFYLSDRAIDWVEEVANDDDSSEEEE